MTEVEPTLIESKTIDEEFSRTHRYPNAKDLNEEQVRRREDDIKELRDKYPTLPDAWIEMAWNFCERRRRRRDVGSWCAARPLPQPLRQQALSRRCATYGCVASSAAHSITGHGGKLSARGRATAATPHDPPSR